MSRKNIFELSSQLITLVTLCAGLVGCGVVQLVASPTSAPILTPAATKSPTFMPTYTLPAPVPVTTSALTTIPSPAPIPVSTATEVFPLDNLRMAYIVDGNLYVQNGSNPPRQLSSSGEDPYPIFSADGEKIVFYRGKIFDNNKVFSINADGSHEQELITSDWLDTLGTGTKAGHLAFVPNTHQILFNTYLCPDDEDLSSSCTAGLFLADTDTGKIKAIMPPTLGGHLPWGGKSPWRGNFNISPDGKLLSVAHDGQIDILDTSGEIVHREIMNYTRSAPIELYPRMYWASNSNDLVIALPTETIYYVGTPPKYDVWRYALDKNIATQIPVDPSPTWIYMECNDLLNVSPNGDWVVYYTENYNVYRGNLIDGKTQIYLIYQCPPALWSSDSTQFIYGENLLSHFMLGSVDEPPRSAPGLFLGWIDANRYIYSLIDSLPIKENIQILVGEIRGESILTYQSNVSIPVYYFSFTMISNK